MRLYHDAWASVELETEQLDLPLTGLLGNSRALAAWRCLVNGKTAFYAAWLEHEARAGAYVTLCFLCHHCGHGLQELGLDLDSERGVTSCPACHLHHPSLLSHALEYTGTAASRARCLRHFEHALLAVGAQPLVCHVAASALLDLMPTPSLPEALNS